MQKSLLVVFFMLLPFMIIFAFTMSVRGLYVKVNTDTGEIVNPADPDYVFTLEQVPTFERPMTLDDIISMIRDCKVVNLNFSIRDKFVGAVDESTLDPIIKPLFKAFSSILAVFDFLIQAVEAVINALMFLLYLVRYLLFGSTGPLVEPQSPTLPDTGGFGGGGGGGRH